MRSFARRVCVSERARERERERQTGSQWSQLLIAACVCVREYERQGHSGVSYLNRGLCVCVCERERDRVISQQSVQPVRNRLKRCLFANTYEHHHCICHVTLFPSQV